MVKYINIEKEDVEYMKRRYIDRLVDKSQKYVSNLMDNTYFYNLIYKNIAKIIKEIYDKNPNITTLEVKEIFRSELETFLEVQSSIGVKRNVARYFIQEDFRKNPSEIKKIYEETVDEVDEKYSEIIMNSSGFNELGDYEQTRRIYMKNAITILRRTKEMLVLNFCGISDKGEKLIKKDFSEVTEEELQQISLNAVSIFGNNIDISDIDLNEIDEVKFNEIKNRATTMIEKTKKNIEFISNLKTNERKRYFKQNRIGTISAFDKIAPYFKTPTEVIQTSDSITSQRNAEEKQVEYWIKNIGIDYKDQIKDRCISGILRNIYLLDKYGLLDENVIRRKQFFERLIHQLNIDNEQINGYIRELPYTKEEILGFFTEEQLQKKSLYQLVAMNAEWSNVATKSIADINNVLFIMEQLNLFEDIKDGKNMTMNKSENSKITDEVIETIFKKIYILHGISYKLLTGTHVEEDGEKTINDEVRKISSSYINDYTQYFSEYCPDIPNDLIQDFSYYKTGANIRANLYKQKDENMLALISIFEERSDINWGIALDDDQQSIEDEKKLLLCFDVPELTMPIRLHIPKAIIKDYLESFHRTHIIKVYEGKDDFVLRDKLVHSYGVYPANIRFSKAINGLKNSIDENINKDFFDFIMHINYLMNNTEYPKSMKTVTGRNKKGKLRYAKKERYINLNTDSVISREEAILEMERESIGVDSDDIGDPIGTENKVIKEDSNTQKRNSNRPNNTEDPYGENR